MSTFPLTSPATLKEGPMVRILCKVSLAGLLSVREYAPREIEALIGARLVVDCFRKETPTLTWNPDLEKFHFPGVKRSLHTVGEQR